jgi:hypothetical protein
LSRQGSNKLFRTKREHSGRVQSVKTNAKAAARLLEAVLIFSAGLCRTWERPAVIEAYPSLLEFHDIYSRIDHKLLHSREKFSVTNINRLEAVLERYSPHEIILATAHHGHFIAFMNACARYGIPLAVCYKAASKSYLDTAECNGLKLIDLNAGRSVLSLFHALQTERTNGCYVAIMMDGPFTSRKRYNFLGYRVAASSLAPLFALKTRSALLPLISCVSADLTLSYAEAPLIKDVGAETTQQLLDFLQSVILQQPFQYQWLSNSILMSDQCARDNAIAFATEALAWRQNQLLEHFTIPPPLATLLSVTMSS